ncbi:MAG: S24/S26 family peptidase, partial [Lachnospira sp.]|nr:S24/S26 family peptidase [Lachnospira sp.]
MKSTDKFSTHETDGISYSTFESELDKHGFLIYTNVGDSMMPLLRQHHDLIVIKKTTGRLKKYDVPLYKRDSGQYVLHRILNVRKNDYVICGDNRYNREYGITDKHI